MISKKVFLVLLRFLGLERRRGHTFYPHLISPARQICDCGSHQAEFLLELAQDSPLGIAIAVEANPVLAEIISKSSIPNVQVINAAMVGDGHSGSVMLNLSINPEASSLFGEVAAAFGKLEPVKVPSISFKEILHMLPNHLADLVKMDIEGAEIDVLLSTEHDVLSRLTQISVEFHENFSPAMRPGVVKVNRHLAKAGFYRVNANWPYTDDVLFVNHAAAGGGVSLRLRVVAANLAYMIRGAIFWTVRYVRGEKLES